MKLNDPFGRLESRHQIGYESMRDTLRSSGVNTRQAALELIGRSKRRALKLISIIILLLLPIVWLLPKAMPVTVSLAIFLVAWVIISNINGRRYIQRYIDEDLR